MTTIFERASALLGRYPLDAWDDAWLFDVEREASRFQPASGTDRAERLWWLNRVRQEIERRANQ